MKILHVLDHSLPHYDGYAFRSAEIVRFQRQAGVDTVHLTSPKHEGTFQALELIGNIPYYRTQALGGLYTLPLINQIGIVVALKRRILELVKTEKPDLIHAHSPSLNGLAALSVARKTGKPMVYEVRSFWEDAAVDAGTCREGDLRYRLTRATETYVIQRADHVVPICRGIAGDLQQRGLAASSLTVISNSVDFERFSAAPNYDGALAARHGLTPGKTFGFAGSFFNFEGLATLIEAIQILAPQDAGYRLLLIGDGPERRGLEAKVRQLALQSVVIFTGRVPHADIKSYYGIIDVLVYPRTSMRLTELVTPLKPLEAMAYGKTVVASDVGGHRELIEDGITGLLFTAGSPRHLADTLARLVANSDLQAELRRRARAHVETKHNWAVTIGKYVELYERLLK